MTSSYPPPPGPRIAYDLDGTVGFIRQTASSTGRNVLSLTPVGLTALNSDVSSGMLVRSEDWGGMSEWTDAAPAQLALLFPKKLRLRGAMFGMVAFGSTGSRSEGDGSPLLRLMGSQDTTNGLDGTWTTIITERAGMERYRVTEISSGYKPKGFVDGVVGTTGVSQTPSYFFGIRNLMTGERARYSDAVSGYGWIGTAGAATRDLSGVRLELFGNAAGSSPVGSYLMNLHLYGEPDTSADEDRIEFISTSGGDPDFSYGDIYPGQIITKTFKVRNRSSVRTASGIELYAVESSPSALQLGTPSLASALAFSTNGTSWSSTLTVSSLGPGADSATLYMRLTVPSGVLGPRGPRLMAEVGAWS